MAEVLAAAMLAAVWTVSWGLFIDGRSWLAYSAVMYAGMTLVIVGVTVHRRVEFLSLDAGLVAPLAGIGVAEACAYLAIGLGFSETAHTSIVAVLSGAFAIPTVLLARLFLRERLSGRQVLGISAVLVGALLVPLI
jgi:drug/metabolite transporter (DMT)-like permease